MVQTLPLRLTQVCPASQKPKPMLAGCACLGHEEATPIQRRVPTPKVANNPAQHRLRSSRPSRRHPPNFTPASARTIGQRMVRVAVAVVPSAGQAAASRNAQVSGAKNSVAGAIDCAHQFRLC
jgi:hypothetical protein